MKTETDPLTPDEQAPVIAKSLRSLALAEVERIDSERQSSRESEEREATEGRIKTAKQFLTAAGVPESEITIEDGFAIADGLKFMGSSSARDRSYVRLSSNCPSCREEVLSDEITSLYTLGTLITNFEPNFDHITRCPGPSDYSPPETQPSVAERLEALLREIVRSERVNEAAEI